MKITAAVVWEPQGSFSLEEVELEEPRAGEVLVRIMAAGVCHTDLATRDGGLPPVPPVVLGHEGAGVVERVGQGVTKVSPGDHVVLTFGFCGNCPNCKRGRPSYCSMFMAHNAAGIRMDGTTPLSSGGRPINGLFFSQSSFATHAIATERNAIKVPADAPLELLGPLGCGIQTGAGSVLNALQPRPGQSIAVFGAGSVGMAAVLGAVVAGCTTIVAVDLNRDRLALAAELGATHTIDPTQGDPVQTIRDATGGAGADYSLECTGVPQVLRQAFDCLAVPGLCGAVGVAPLGTEVGLDTFTLLVGRGVRGIIEGDSVPDVFIPAMVELWQQGRFPFDRLIRHYDFAQINEAATDSEKGVTLKPVLRMPS